MSNQSAIQYYFKLHQKKLEELEVSRKELIKQVMFDVKLKEGFTLFSNEIDVRIDAVKTPEQFEANILNFARRQSEHDEGSGTTWMGSDI